VDRTDDGAVVGASLSLVYVFRSVCLGVFSFQFSQAHYFLPLYLFVFYSPTQTSLIENTNLREPSFTRRAIKNRREEPSLAAGAQARL
jgi:hypothetical protein